MSKYPVREMIKRGWLREAGVDDLQYQLASFFGVSSIAEVPYLSHAAKKSSYEEREIPAAELAWLFRVRQIAKTMICPVQYTQHRVGSRPT